MLPDDAIDFYAALREMESSDSFSVSWCATNNTDSAGKIVTENNVSFAGKRITEDYELVFFKKSDESLLSAHLFSLMFFNGKKMIIQ
jgi:hypothetical protein